jgi:4-amino-4-deoxy-L-arabinose transferase-like glycosyltransferase
VRDATSSTTQAAPPERRSRSVPAWAAAARRLAVPAILAVSLVPRLPNLGAPPLERHSFRQTQTAITVQAWLDHGFTLLDYELPVFGPPWKVPFEFPTYQASAYALARLGLPLDVACRVASLLWFYASALLLLVVTRRFAGETVAAATLAAYVLSPFGLMWSRAVLIDFASVAFALAYLLAVASWAARPRAAAALAAVVAGALAYLTKITTVAVVVVPIGLAAVGALRRAWPAGRRARAGALVPLAAMGAIPLAVGSAWTRWTDAVKDAAPATRWLTSERLTGWTVGNLAQRLTWDNWAEIFARMNWIVPGLFWIPVAFALAALVRRGREERLVLAAALGSVLFPILAFFNLFQVHDYYLIAVTPGLAVLTGFGIAELLALRFPLRAPILLALLAAAVPAAKRPWAYARVTYEDTRRQPVVALARLVERVTPRDGWVLIEGDDWNPRIPYLSRRRAFMLKPPVVGVELVAGRPEVATLVCFTCPPELLARWPARELVGREADADVYRIRRE